MGAGGGRIRGAGVSNRWLILDLSAPLMAFGAVTVDHFGPTRAFPAASALTGLLANALGWDWTARAAHQDLQDRLIFASAVLRAGVPLTDTQNAKLENNDKGWTTFGVPEGRDGATYDSPHRRQRDYLADASVRVVLRLAEGVPDLDTVAEALKNPARPLFIGRKPCLPSRPVFGGWAQGQTAYDALLSTGAEGCPAQWPADQGPEGRAIDLADLRNWISGLHGGSRLIYQGILSGGGA